MNNNKKKKMLLTNAAVLRSSTSKRQLEAIISIASAEIAKQPHYAHCMNNFLARPNKHYLTCYLKLCSARFQGYTTDMPAKKKKGTKSKRPTFDPEIVTGAKEKKVEGLLIFEHCVS